ncbi:MAG: phytase [Chloroflexota bacterium]
MPGAPTPAMGATLTIGPAADGWVSSADPNVNNGSHSRLKVRTASTKRFESHLRFTVAGAGSVSDARLRLFVADGSPNGGSVFLSSASWTESGLTWNTRPALIGSQVAAIGAVASKTWVEINVSSAVTGDGTYSFALTGGVSDAAGYHSRESSATKRPQLVLTTGPGGGGVAPSNTGAPTVSAAGGERAVHYALPGTWTSSDPITYSFQWVRCSSSTACAPIPDAVSDRYAVGADDIGAGLRMDVTATNGSGSTTASSELTAPIPPRATPTAGDPVIAVAGDIACDPGAPAFNGGAGTATECRQQATSDLLVGRGLTSVLIPGDIQYGDGAYAKFLRSYDLSWGRVNGITRPTPGNHEYGTAGAAGYFAYFGAAAGNPSQGWYSFDIGSWHVIALNSNCNVVGCGAGSAQEQWLRADLAASAADCTLAYWHHPRFSSGTHGGDASVAAFWSALYEHGADVVLNGHDHDYERFAPQAPTGAADPDLGIRQFVIGTGGEGLRPFESIAANSEARNATDYGVLDLTLGGSGYAWEFIPVSGDTYTDAGTGTCHGAPADPPPPPAPGAGEVTASVETDPVPHGNDAADDPAIWIHPTDPALSTVIGTDKQPGGGLAVYDLAGNELHPVGGTAMNNVDLRDGFPLGGSTVSLVTASDRANKAIAVFRVDLATRGLVNVASRLITTGSLAGFCMYHSQVDGSFYAFTNNSNGIVKQWELFDNGAGLVDATLVRSFDVGDTTEGCVADDERGHFYISEESVGIWRYGAEPGAGVARIQVDSTGPGGQLTAHVEGLAIAYTDAGGHLIASSQGNDSFVIYDRGTYAHVGTFRIVDSPTIDGVRHTDGIEVTTAPLGSAFPGGLFVAQDGTNDDGSVNQNFKLVPWDEILAGL